MQITTVVRELEMDVQESQNQRDKRVEELWRKLDPQGKGELDLKGLQKGLRRIDHPLKNADGMLREMVEVVDTSKDGKVQYEEFRVFVEAAERQLLLLFKSIDRNHDGKVGREELKSAFQKAGLSVPTRRLSGFFDEIDMNHDGFISFDEWRDFLLFMPPSQHGSALEAALSYYNSIVTLNAEGDSMVTEEKLEGLGTTGFLLQALFGSLLRLAQPISPEQYPYLNPPPGPAPGPAIAPVNGSGAATSFSSHQNPTTKQREPPTSSQLKPPLQETADAVQRGIMAAAIVPLAQSAAGSEGNATSVSATKAIQTATGSTSNTVPPFDSSGYFIAGALAGGISRTATAPLDRLKVYLLVNTKSKVCVDTGPAKKGQPLAAFRNAGKPIGDAVRDLWKAGGFRTFFAGNGLNVIKIMPETAIKFGSYEAAKRTLANFEGHGDPTQINPVSRFAAGGVAGMTAQFCVYPLDTLKFRLQCETVEGGLTGNALLVQTARKMVAEGGFRSAYRGITMGLIGMFPYSAIDMGTFEFLKKTFSRYKARYHGIHEEDAAPGNMVTGIIGATSGAFGATVVYPLNVLRTRLQTQGTVMHPPTYTGIWDVAFKTWKNEGVRGMYKGLTPNLLKVAPALSITWIVYENSKRVMGLH